MNIQRFTHTVALFALGAAGAAAAADGSRLTPGAVPQPKTYVVVKPGTHPGILFSEQELPAMRKRAQGSGMAAEAYRKVKETANTPTGLPANPKAAVGREGGRLARQLESMALVYQVEKDEALGRRAVEVFRAAATGIDPREFFKAVDSDFFATEHWPKAFAAAWDWLYPIMTAEERQAVLQGLEEWNAALFHHTESWWWRDASYNCGAIPVGAQGMLLAAIQGETKHPEFQRWFTTCFRKVRENYFPLTWRANGVCNEGPGYAHYHGNPTQFAEAVRRTGGPDIIAGTGAVNAMHYLRHQWMPQGGCGPVGDNTEYGRRVFQSIYLFGIRELGDRAGLWTFEKYTDRERIDPLRIFLFWPDRVEAVSPAKLDLPVSYYFELDRHRAGNVFARNAWEDEEAHWFEFTTRYASANHTHYDMNSFLFTAFGEQFATHANVWGYSHPDHGVDFEHNMIVVDEGGMPAKDNKGSAGDDGSIRGFMTGVGLGHFADYVRGDARLSYADRSLRAAATPAERANRTAVFVKQGPNPYIVVADDIKKDGAEHDYHWQWWTEAKSVAEEGTLDKPFLIDGQKARCAVALLEPGTREHVFEVVKSPDSRRGLELGRLRVNRRAVETRYVAVAAAWRKEARQPSLRKGPEVTGNAAAASVVVEGEDFRDLIVWQPEDAAGRGQKLSAGQLKTDALMAVVRTDRAGKVLGYLVGDGSVLEFAGRTLVRAPQPVSVSADGKAAMAQGPRRAREGEPPLAAAGSFWVPDGARELWADGEPIKPALARDRMAALQAPAGK